MKLTSVRIPIDLHNRMQLYVTKEGMTIQGFMRKAIELYLMKLSTRTTVLNDQARLCTCVLDGECSCSSTHHVFE
jgi:hypothetical protein